MSHPRYSDPRLSDPVERSDEALGGLGSWIAGVAVIAFIAFIVIAGVNHNRNTASNGPPPITSDGATRPLRSPATTGSGTMSPQPMTPAAPSKSGTQ